MLVLDASVVIRACDAQDGFALLGDPALFAPALMWSEVRSALHEAAWRGEVSAPRGQDMLHALERSPVRLCAHALLGREAWRVADELGMAKTYDAEYVALARLLGCRLVTLDGRLRRGAERLGFVVGPSEL